MYTSRLLTNTIHSELSLIIIMSKTKQKTKSKPQEMFEYNKVNFSRISGTMHVSFLCILHTFPCYWHYFCLYFYHFVYKISRRS